MDVGSALGRHEGYVSPPRDENGDAASGVSGGHEGLVSVEDVRRRAEERVGEREAVAPR